MGPVDIAYNKTPVLENKTCDEGIQRWQGGEVLKYKVYYNWNFVWFSAGEVIFEIKDLGSKYRFKAIGRTYPSYEWFYRVNDYYETTIDKKSMLPLKSIRILEEGDYRKYVEQEYRYRENKVYVHEGKSKDRLTTKVIDLKDCTWDILSTLYLSRNVVPDQLTRGAEFPVRLLLDDEYYDLNYQFLKGPVTRKIKHWGDEKVAVFKPRLIKGEVFDEDDEMIIYVSNDTNKLPIMIESPLVVGKMKAILDSWTGLKEPLSK